MDKIQSRIPTIIFPEYPGEKRERIGVELITSIHNLKASREGSRKEQQSLLSDGALLKTVKYVYEALGQLGQDEPASG